jgi:hypothetical protein
LHEVLYGCETWSLTLRDEHRLRVFENRVLRWIFEPKMDEVTGEWRKLHNEELRDLYSSPSIIRIINFILGFCILLRSLLRLYYSDRQSQQSFLFSHSTHSLQVSVRASQETIIFT